MASTQENLPTADISQKTELIAGITSFDPSNLKHAETNEKNPLPDKEVIQMEKKEKYQLVAGVEKFDVSKLKHIETCEKNPLPTKEVIEEEKKA